MTTSLCMYFNLRRRIVKHISKSLVQKLRPISASVTDIRNFHFIQQLETVTKSGEVISTELSFKDKEKSMELQRTMSKGTQQLTMSEDGVVDFNNNFQMDSNRASNHADVLGGMSELKGELRRETERMNAKMGVVEAQMRLVLKLLRRNNKITDIDPEIGMQLDELMDYDDTKKRSSHSSSHHKPGEDDVDDTEWFVADAQGWKDGPESRGTTGSSSRASTIVKPPTTSSHSRVMSVASKPAPVESKKTSTSAQHLQKPKIPSTVSSSSSNMKPSASGKDTHTVINVPNKSSKAAPSEKLSTASKSNQKSSVPAKKMSTSQASSSSSSTSKPAQKVRQDASTTKGSASNNTFEDDFEETIIL